MVKPKQSQIKKAAQDFVAEWKNRGKEDKDYVEFWEDLLEDVYGHAFFFHPWYGSE